MTANALYVWNHRLITIESPLTLFCREHEIRYSSKKVFVAVDDVQHYREIKDALHASYGTATSFTGIAFHHYAKMLGSNIH